MLKQAASAAASSSSGLEPAPFSNRELALYWPAMPVCPRKSPWPLSPPFQLAVALLVGIVSLLVRVSDVATGAGASMLDASSPARFISSHDGIGCRAFAPAVRGARPEQVPRPRPR